jgi:hypothetical protein
MNKVFIMGPANTGSGAIVEYLCSRSDGYDPLKGQEFRLIQERDGLSSLHRSLTTEFHCDDAMYALIAFENLAKRLGKNSRKFRIPPRLGYGFSKRIPSYDKAISQFLKDITLSTIGIFPLQDLLRLSTIDWIRVKCGGFPRSANIIRQKPIPVPPDEFMKHAKKLISSLFFETHEGEKIKKDLMIFDQCGSFFSPISSTQYFGESRKIILVTRDPCDVFASQRRKSNISGSAEDFARYQAGLAAHVVKSEWRDERVLRVAFEDFVLNHDQGRKKICDYLEIDSTIASSYDPRDSIKSIGRYKELLSSDEIATLRSTPQWPKNADRDITVANKT